MSHGYTKKKKEQKRFRRQLKKAVLSDNQFEVAQLQRKRPDWFDEAVYKAIQAQEKNTKAP